MRNLTIICLCCGVVIGGDFVESVYAAQCHLVRSPPPDFGPPPVCDHSSPHGRSTFMTSLVSSTSSVSSVAVTTPTIAYIARDAEDAAEMTDRGIYPVAATKAI